MGKEINEDAILAGEGGPPTAVDPTQKGKKEKKQRKVKQEKGQQGEVADAANGHVQGAGEKDVVEANGKKGKKRKIGEGSIEPPCNAETTNDQVNGSAGTEAQKVKKKKKKNKKDKNLDSEGAANGAAQDKGRVTSISNRSEQGGSTGSSKGKSKGDSKADAEEVKDSNSKVGAEVKDWGDAPEVKVSGDGVTQTWPRALGSFSEAEGALDSRLLAACAQFPRPSPIQQWCWPVLVPKLCEQQQAGGGGGKESGKREENEGGGRDLIGIAATGSGKTLAFGIPALQHALLLQQQQQQKGGKAGKGPPAPSVLVLAPTRELALQISKVLEDTGATCGVHCVCVYGGAAKGPQKADLRTKRPAVVVATPGRLKDLLEDESCTLSNVTFAVLDEADRMLDLGFEPDIRAILAQTSKTRRTVMLSATWPMAVSQLAMDFLVRPVHVTVGGAAKAGGLSANHNVKQVVEVIDSHARDARLQVLLNEYHKSRKNRVLVFVLYKKEAQRVESLLSSRGWKVGALHGDKGQADRTRAVEKFKSGEVPLLVATDVAARGLDIPDVECVINYSFPLTTEDYVHRIGRTGRAGKTGVAHTLFTVADKARTGELVNVLREAGQEVPSDLLKFGTAVKKKESKLYGAHFREIAPDSSKPKKTTFADSDED